MKKKRTIQVGIGSISVIMFLMVLSLYFLAILNLSTVTAHFKLAQKALNHTYMLYDGENKIESIKETLYEKGLNQTLENISYPYKLTLNDLEVSIPLSAYETMMATIDLEKGYRISWYLQTELYDINTTQLGE